LYFHHYRLTGVLERRFTWTFFLWMAALAMMLAGIYQLIQTLIPLL
jgi:hypothetical protein